MTMMLSVKNDYKTTWINSSSKLCVAEITPTLNSLWEQHISHSFLSLIFVGRGQVAKKGKFWDLLYYSLLAPVTSYRCLYQNLSLRAAVHHALEGNSRCEHGCSVMFPSPCETCGGMVFNRGFGTKIGDEPQDSDCHI